MACWSRERLTQFIELYKMKECLWKVKSNDYSNRVAREDAYLELLQFVKEFDEDVNRDSIIKKINNIRASYRREYRRVEQSRREKGPNDLYGYVPKLWYFDLLTFVNDQDDDISQANDSCVLNGDGDEDSKDAVDVAWDVSNVDEEDIKYGDQIMFGPTPIALHTAGVPPSSCLTSSNYNDTLLQTTPSQRFPGQDYINNSSSTSTHNGLGGKRKWTPPDNEILTTVRETLRLTKTLKDHQIAATAAAVATATTTTAATAETDQLDVFGQYVARTLRQMTKDQAIHAQKVISDTLYEGQLGGLSK